MSAVEDRAVIRDLARQWSEWAARPVMAERKRLWRAVHDLRAERPVILFETSSVDGFVSLSELRCTDPLLRAVERDMRDTIRHAEEVGDDVVVEPYFRIGWQLELSDFGVQVETRPTTNSDGSTSLGYTFNFPIAAPRDAVRLKKRAIAVLYAGASLVLRYTRFGRDVFAVGSNEYAARLAGIDTRRIKFTAVVLGGVSMAGGKGGLLGVIIAVLIPGAIRNGMVHIQEAWGVSYYWREVVKGLILAISIDAARIMATRKRQRVRQ